MQLYVRKAASDYRTAGPREILNGAREGVGRWFRAGRPIERPVDAAERFAGQRVGLDAERFTVRFLTTKHCVIAYEELFFGTVDSTSVHPLEGVKRVLRHNAAAVILGHNDPSGDSTQSAADEAITRLDLDGAPHRNPDDEEIPVPHLHVYRPGYGDPWAIPVPADCFRDPGNGWTIFEDFPRYCNITQPPPIDRGLFA